MYLEVVRYFSIYFFFVSINLECILFNNLQKLLLLPVVWPWIWCFTEVTVLNPKIQPYLNIFDFIRCCYYSLLKKNKNTLLRWVRICSKTFERGRRRRRKDGGTSETSVCALWFFHCSAQLLSPRLGRYSCSFVCSQGMLPFISP